MTAHVDLDLPLVTPIRSSGVLQQSHLLTPALLLQDGVAVAVASASCRIDRMNRIYGIESNESNHVSESNESNESNVRPPPRARARAPYLFDFPARPLSPTT